MHGIRDVYQMWCLLRRCIDLRIYKVCILFVDAWLVMVREDDRVGFYVRLGMKGVILVLLDRRFDLLNRLRGETYQGMVLEFHRLHERIRIVYPVYFQKIV